MVINKRKKNSRQRASRTHGWGSKKKHRGAGNRGGRGNAGTGKRAHTMKPSLWKGEPYLGKFGFKKKNIKVKFKPICIKKIEANLARWVSDKSITEQAGTFSIDLPKLGYNKLLSNGQVNKKLKINVPYASSNAVEKIKEKGGEVTGLESKESKPAK